jgi:hypothetical protein
MKYYTGLGAAPVLAQEAGQNIARDRQELDAQEEQQQIVGADRDAHRQRHEQEQRPEFPAPRRVAVHIRAAADRNQNHTRVDDDLEECGERINVHQFQRHPRLKAQLQNHADQRHHQEQHRHGHEAKAGVLLVALRHVQQQDQEAADHQDDFGKDTTQ